MSRQHATLAKYEFAKRELIEAMITDDDSDLLKLLIIEMLDAEDGKPARFDYVPLRFGSHLGRYISALEAISPPRWF